MSVCTSTTLASCSLADYGRTLAVQLCRAKSEEAGAKDGIYPMVEKAIDKLLERLRMDQGLYIKEALSSLMKKIERTLEDFIKHDADNATHYKELANKVKGFKSVTQSPAIPTVEHPASAFDCRGTPGPPHSSEPLSYENLSDEDIKCSLLWFCLVPEGTVISRRDLIYWWVGMGLIKPEGNHLDGDGGKRRCNEILGELLAEGFIERAIRGKKAFNIYRMQAGIRCKVMEQANKSARSQKTAAPYLQLDNDYSLISFHASDDESRPVNTHALLNISVNNLNSTRFAELSKRKNVEVLHLGTCRHDAGDRDYVVVEDVAELGNALKQLKQVTCLSLQGVSGVVELPDSVCKLEKLVVLDLRACNNLESLPKAGMESLHQLTHLDLSECYLLNHIPAAIASLSELRVLKGFVINPDPDHGQAAANGKEASIASSCEFRELSKLTNLIKLTIRTRRMNFPTKQDLETLYSLQKLNNLRIAWVGNSSDAQTVNRSGRLPAGLQKLELQAVPKNTLSQLLGLISNKIDIRLEKLYIRGGGGLVELFLEKQKFFHIKEVRLLYLPKLRMAWHPFIQSFPDLTRLQIIKCPNLIFFPCCENGVWER